MFSKALSLVCLFALLPIAVFAQSSVAVPFVNAGATTLLIRGSGNAWHAGGGVDYWLRDGFGLRLELRDHMPFGGTAHLWGARIGVTWAPGGRIAH
jgi:hypothetical protein